MHTDRRDRDGKPHRPKFCLNIEGQLIDWDEPTITTEQVIQLGGWDLSLGVQQIDLKTNEAKTLAPGEVVQLRPGLGFCKKVSWKRGADDD